MKTKIYAEYIFSLKGKTTRLDIDKTTLKRKSGYIKERKIYKSKLTRNVNPFLTFFSFSFFVSFSFVLEKI